MDDFIINSIIGEGTSFTGELEINGLLRIDGDFSGNIRKGQKILVGRTGRVKADIDAETAIIGGVLKGDILAASKVVILSSGLVIGNIVAPSIIVEDGGIIDGRVAALSDTALLNKEKKNLIGVGKDWSRSRR